MTYCLGVDLGTSFTAAAVFEGGRAELVELGQRRPQMPTVVYIPPSGKPAIGDAAERRAVNEPERVVREFKRRLGDQVGSLVGDEFWTAEALMARVLVHVLTEVTRQQGEEPMLVALTHPANWGPYKLDLLAEVARLAQLADDRVLFVSEPVAAAVHHSHRGRTAGGQRYVVYDLGGGTFDATVVQVHEGEDGDSRSASVLGEPGGLERLGGMDFDEALRRLVERLVGQRLEDLDTSDPRVLHGLAQLRNELVEAKEALSTETHVEVPLFL
ncbi:MAG: Hsp70 family protein, partial [Acidimicrobiia bacterium]